MLSRSTESRVKLAQPDIEVNNKTSNLRCLQKGCKIKQKKKNLTETLH